MSKRVHVFISGRVQGVGFRASTRREARTKGVKGWVKNLADGRVEAVFEGENEKVDEMIEFCKEGPRAASVDDLEINEEDYKEEFKEFKISY
ncbi:MAG: Acylphosphatase AcyP [Candidatus Methanohalarchaeum thermophilum]|uniref:Acylphosphatase n=1 Tax=Methanohalarchaeum thermophilum TaxID=1903181 RepID=A0A1Q6DU77_METT1|nr:MAG: Acylphosphatase AcyP [Candidatus Methanohalarchaeum thermophilum]